ncbi:MAG: BTAD domain-containing putative transcriptional regulator, partial [Actinomycetota bacterium]
MRFSTLGPISVTGDDGPLALGGPRQRAVLGLLLATPGHSIASDTVIDEVWGDEAGDGATASLHTHISNLRAVVGKERIVRDSSGYRLELLDGDEVDVRLFEAATREAQRTTGIDPKATVEELDRGLGLWRGRPFEGLEDVPALAAEIVRLDELRATAQVERFEAILQAGDVPLIADLEEVCRQRSLDERPWGLLMRALYRSGRHAEALRTYGKVRTLFGEELGIEPSPALARLEEQILLHDPSLDGAASSPETDLPSYLTSFIGRLDESLALSDALADHRLVTILGPGGAGKTRLASEVASSLGGRFPDGVWLIDLAQVADSSRIGAVIGETIGAVGGIGESLDSVVDGLRGRRSLIVLDNCEHVVDAVRGITGELLRSCPRLVILATSRRPLDISGEFRCRIDGLATDPVDGAPSDAATLFSDRATSVGSDAAWGPKSGEAIATICRKLDGMPLALELAAARTDVLSPAEIADLLTHRFALLVDDRQDRDIHRSLEAAVGWSYGLL